MNFRFFVVVVVVHFPLLRHTISSSPESPFDAWQFHNVTFIRLLALHCIRTGITSSVYTRADYMNTMCIIKLCLCLRMFYARERECVETIIRDTLQFIIICHLRGAHT